MADDWQAPEPEDVDSLLASLAEVKAFYNDHNRLALETNQKLDALEDRLAFFVPRKRFRLVIGFVVAAILVLLAIGFMVRGQDRARDEDRRAAIAREAEHDRQNAIRGCERANDLRALQREVLEIALADRPIPEGLSPELTEAYRQAQANTAALRERLLSLEGAQHVDCRAQFPATNGSV